ncbi:MAG: Gfo/Idh/MocA family oxidoreductase [Myxococcota bacterium]
MAERALRIGILGAARIAPAALVTPARSVDGAIVAAVAARDAARAEAFARKHGIARVARDYAELVEDRELDAIYNPLPNGLHAEWTIRALEAGKHVLCEKPLAANADEARAMAAAAARTGRVLMEAFHWRYHRAAERAIEIVRSGELGRVERVEAAMCFPLPLFGDIRYRLDLAGGATMDAGCYAVSIARHLAGEEPAVASARAKLRSPGVDRALVGELAFPSGASGRVRASMWSARLLDLSARVVGSEGELRFLNPVMPQLLHRLRVRTRSGTRTERAAGEPTYTAQLRAFVRAVDEGAAIPTDGNDGVANMVVIDALYRAAGLPPRGTPEAAAIARSGRR